MVQFANFYSSKELIHKMNKTPTNDLVVFHYIVQTFESF